MRFEKFILCLFLFWNRMKPKCPNNRLGRRWLTSNSVGYKKKSIPRKDRKHSFPTKRVRIHFSIFLGVSICMYIYIYILLSPLLGVFIWFNPPSLRMARGGLNMSFKPNRYRTHTHMYSTNYCMCHLYLYIYISLNFIFTIHIYIVTLVFF